MVKVTKETLDKLVAAAVKAKLKEADLSRIINEPPAEAIPVNSAAETQVSMVELPIMDSNWFPGNRVELGNAMKQMAEMVPDKEVIWFYSRLRKLIDDAIDREDVERMQPRLGKMADE
jgi:hypothetical protein